MAFLVLLNTFSKIKFGLKLPYLVKTFDNGQKKVNINFISHFLNFAPAAQAKPVTWSPVLRPVWSFFATQIKIIYCGL